MQNSNTLEGARLTFVGIEYARGIAALMVLACHYSYMVTDGRTVLNFLWTGVDLFFVISGFVFAERIFSEKICLRRFFLRRLFRIYPLYVISLIIYFFLTTNHPEKNDYLIDHLLFLQTLSSKEEAFFFNPAFWSLPVEVEFYILVPILTYLMRFSHALITILAISLILKLFLITQTTPGAVDGYTVMGVHLTGILPEFLLGIYLYKIVIAVQSNPNSKTTTIGLVATTIGVASLCFLANYFVEYGDEGIKGNTLFGGLFNFLSALSYSFILLPIALISKRNASSHPTRILMFLGSISYPIYLLHNATPKLIQSLGIALDGGVLFVASTILTLIISTLAHKTIEEPARLYGKQLSKKLN